MKDKELMIMWQGGDSVNVTARCTGMDVTTVLYHIGMRNKELGIAIRMAGKMLEDDRVKALYEEVITDRVVNVVEPDDKVPMVHDIKGQAVEIHSYLVDDEFGHEQGCATYKMARQAAKAMAKDYGHPCAIWGYDANGKEYWLECYGKNNEQ